MRTPYVYRVTDLETSKWYIGSNYSKGCHPCWLGVRYFTTSKLVKPMFKNNPARFVKEILAIGSIDYVVEIEARMLHLLDARNDPRSYNGHNGDGKMNCSKFGKLGGIASIKTNKANGTAVFSAEVRKAGGEYCRDNKIGIHSSEHLGKGGKVGGKISGNNTKLRKVGIHAPGVNSKAGKLGGSLPWWHDPTSSITTRSKTQPEGFVKGRGTFKGIKNG